MEVSWMFGTKALSDDTIMKTQATVDSKEGNLSVHNKNEFYLSFLIHLYLLVFIIINIT